MNCCGGFCVSKMKKKKDSNLLIVCDGGQVCMIFYFFYKLKICGCSWPESSIRASTNARSRQGNLSMPPPPPQFPSALSTWDAFSSYLRYRTARVCARKDGVLVLGGNGRQVPCGWMRSRTHTPHKPSHCAWRTGLWQRHSEHVN